MVELGQQRLAAALFVVQSLAFRSPNSSLNGVGVKAAPEVTGARPEIESMQIVAVGHLKRRIDRQGGRRGSQLRVLPSASCAVLLDALGQRPKLFGVVDERITVIGERQ